MRTFRDLRAWQAAHALVLEVYKATDRLPAGERHGLCSQMRRAAVSVAANIAEGAGGTPAEFARFLRIARGSLDELRYYFILAADLGYFPRDASEALEAQADDIAKMLHGLTKQQRAL